MENQVRHEWKQGPLSGGPPSDRTLGSAAVRLLLLLREHLRSGQRGRALAASRPASGERRPRPRFELLLQRRRHRRRCCLKPLCCGASRRAERKFRAAPWPPRRPGRRCACLWRQLGSERAGLGKPDTTRPGWLAGWLPSTRRPRSRAAAEEIAVRRSAISAVGQKQTTRPDVRV